MSNVVKLADCPASLVLPIFEHLNPGKVKIVVFDFPEDHIIVTDTDPKELLYPEGWYYAKGTFRNKGKTSTGIYEEVLMMRTNGAVWDVPYSTLYED